MMMEALSVKNVENLENKATEQCDVPHTPR